MGGPAIHLTFFLSPSGGEGRVRGFEKRKGDGLPEEEGNKMTRPGLTQMKMSVGIVGLLMGLTVLLLLGSGSIGPVTPGWAQTTDRSAALSLQEGEVTGVGAKSIQINGKEYTLDPEVVVKDSSGAPRTLKDIVTGDLVQFHVKRTRIDQLILMLPS